MWKYKEFKTAEAFATWMYKNSHKYQVQEIFVNNAYRGVVYKRLRKIM